MFVRLFLFVSFSASVAVAEPQRPNIVIVLADDMGYGDAGCYNDQSKIPTPHIDRLATEGTRFTDAHTPSSVCTPTRYGLLTGRYCWRSQLKEAVLWPWDPPLIEQDRLTLPAMLQKTGYHTACVGKWHLGWTWQRADGSTLKPPIAPGHYDWKVRGELGDLVDFTKPIRGGPIERGFDYYFGDDVPNFPPFCFIENDRTTVVPTVKKPKDLFGHPGPAMPGWDLSTVMPLITQQAVQYIEGRAGKDQPFFLYFSLTAPHTAIAPTPHFIGKSQAGWYGDFVHQVDWTLGQVLAALERTGAANNTLVIFTSDNGSPQRDGEGMEGKVGSVQRFGHDPSRPWRGLKGDAWEGGHRVPFVARWPGHVPAGATSVEPIVLTDLMRTIADIVGHELPDDAAEDSVNVRPALLGEPLNRPIREHLVHHTADGTFAIRQGRWKLIFSRYPGGFTPFKPPKDAPAGQLYDLEADPAEANNLYRERPEIVQRLAELMDRLKRGE